jgi:predicted N-acetyltransferase YhbS
MEITTDRTGRTGELVRLFTTTFTASEGAEEGQVIGTLVRALLRDVPQDDLLSVIALEADALVGCVLFTPLGYANDPRKVALLSPAAVAPEHQRRGIGQALIAQGQAELRARDFDVLVTYGDPAYYGKSGLAPVSETIVPSPQPLNMPEGWLAQSLTDAPLTPLKGPATCVAPFADPALW